MSPNKKNLLNKKTKLVKNKVIIYAIFQITERNKQFPHHIPLSFSSTKEEAIEIIERLLYIKHFDHYKMWCEIRGLPTQFNGESWMEYSMNLFDDDGKILDEEDVFTIEEVAYSASNVASFLRMFVGCKPLFLPHEEEEEAVSYVHDNGENEYLKKMGEIEPPIKELIRGIKDEMKDRSS